MLSFEIFPPTFFEVGKKSGKVLISGLIGASVRYKGLVRRRGEVGHACRRQKNSFWGDLVRFKAVARGISRNKN